MSAYRLGVLRCIPIRIQKNILKHCSLSDSCDGSDNKETSESKQDKFPSSYTFNNPSAPSKYDYCKYGHNLPVDSVKPNFETLPNFPTGIFRCTKEEVLGAGASKNSTYQNPEYFSYHHMSFYDMNLILRCYREESPDTGRNK